MYNSSRDEAVSRRAPPRQESLLPPKQDHNPRHRSKASPPSRSMSWSDPDELTQLLDFFTTPPLRSVELPKHLVHGSSSLASGISMQHDRGLYKSSLGQSPSTPPDSYFSSPTIMEPPTKVPLKAQRLMGIDTSTTYIRSTFDDWEDEEHLQTAVGSPHRRSIVRRSKDSKPLPPTSRDSKWSTLSQRFRSSSTTPMSLRLRNSTSSPNSSFDDLGKDLPTVKIASPDRINSMVHTPIRPTFGAEQRKVFSESKVRTVSGRSEWAEARASSRALNSSMDSLRRSDAKNLPSHHHTTTRKNSSDSTGSDIPVQIISATPPLRFNPSRRPRAPFPPTDSFDSSSADEGRGPDKMLPLASSPVLARCPSKMLAPSRMMRPTPATPTKVEPMPPRPRRPTDSNIFVDKAMRSPVKPASPGRRMMSTPPRPPPPSIPVPPLPSPSPMDRTKTKQVGKTEGLKVALGMPACSPLFSSGDKEFLQTSPETSPQAVVFCGEKVAQAFAATIKQVDTDALCSEDQVELIVGGVSFEAPLSVLLKGDLNVASIGLAASLQKHMDKHERDALSHKLSSLTLAVPLLSQTRGSKNTVNSYDDGTSLHVSSRDSLSSSEGNSEEDNLPVFAYDTAEMTWTHEIDAKEAQESHTGPIKTLHAPTPLRSMTHARSPTSVSLDCDDSIEGDQEEREQSNSSDVIQLRRNSATPELVGPNTFIFTTSPPPTTPKLKSPQVLQVILHRDPQTYVFVLHYLKKGSLPFYFTEERYSFMERQRALQKLCLECRWLGYSGLAEKCNEALDTISTGRKTTSVSK